MRQLIHTLEMESRMFHINVMILHADLAVVMHMLLISG